MYLLDLTLFQHQVLFQTKIWDFAIRAIMNYVFPFVREAKAPATKDRGHKAPIG